MEVVHLAQLFRRLAHVRLRQRSGNVRLGHHQAHQQWSRRTVGQAPTQTGSQPAAEAFSKRLLGSVLASSHSWQNGMISVSVNCRTLARNARWLSL
jgi:hypothetical protein